MCLRYGCARMRAAGGSAVERIDGRARCMGQGWSYTVRAPTSLLAPFDMRGRVRGALGSPSTQVLRFSAWAVQKV
jgi:hypothetical protein